MYVSTAINAGTLIVRSINNFSNNFLKQQIQEHYLCKQQHHHVLMCFADKYRGGANVTLLSSPSHLYSV